MSDDLKKITKVVCEAEFTGSLLCSQILFSPSVIPDSGLGSWSAWKPLTCSTGLVTVLLRHSSSDGGGTVLQPRRELVTWCVTGTSRDPPTPL